MEQATSWRLGFFLGGFALFSIAEYALHYRERELLRIKRWPGNILLSVAASSSIRFLAPAGLLGVALWAKHQNMGLLNMLGIKQGILINIFTLMIMDFAIYWQHVFSHKWQWLWKLHRVHHTDIDLDASSALRFHPLEIILSLLYKMAWVVLLGLPAFGVFIFEIILNTMAMFNHANLGLPKTIEKYLRYILVTPQMHIVHHSIEREEHDRNFSFNLSLWDRLFKTYLNEFKSSGMIGLHHHRETQENKFFRLLMQPMDKNN